MKQTEKWLISLQYNHLLNLEIDACPYKDLMAGDKLFWTDRNFTG
jgi:hypothetical protein